MIEISKEHMLETANGDRTAYFYFYTPMCGTCQLASKMLEIVNETIPELQIYKCNLNYFPEIANKFEIESVPCFAILDEGKISKKIYAFQSVQYLYDVLKKYDELKN